MWTQQQRWCTACAFAVLLGFTVFALYIDPAGLAEINPFSTKECEVYKNSQRANNETYHGKPVSVLKSSNGTSLNDSTKERPDEPQTQRYSAADLYACRLAVYTRVLAYFTGLLAVATVFLIVAGLYQGVHLGRAVRIAIDEFNASHRPRIRVREVTITPPKLVAESTFAVQFSITNVGDSEAKITEVYATIYLSEDPDLPLPMTAPPMQRIWFEETRIRPAFIAGPFLFLHRLDDPEDIRKALYVMGTITYTDVYDLQNERARRIFFCRRFRESPPRFEHVDNRDYESEC
jgi:hypothetical protein